MRRLHRLAARLAIIALLIDGLLPAAVAAASPDRTTPLVPLCGAAIGAPLLPLRKGSPLPVRHCSLCTVSSACFVGLLPSRSGSAFAGRRAAGAAHPAILLSVAMNSRPVSDGAAQPRAPPSAFSWHVSDY